MFRLNTFSLFRNLRGRLAPLVVAIAALISSAAVARDINVGLLRSNRTLAAGIAAAAPGDRVLLDPGLYLDDTAIVDKPLTIEGAGAGATLRITTHLANQKGILIGTASLTVRNLTFEGAFVLDNEGKNGAGIRMEYGDLLVDGCTFLNNQDGMLVNPNSTATVTILNSNFVGNGAGDGYSHGMYVNEVGQLTVRDSTFTGTKVGHNIKSRALRTTIVNTVMEDGVVGTSSYGIDMPNGGIAIIDGVTITQGPNTSNPAMIAYGAEGNLKASNSLTITNSTFINKLNSASAVAVYNFTASVPAVLTNNVMDSVGTILRGPGSGASAPAGPVVRQGSIFSSAQPGAQSYLRFYNPGVAAGTVKVTLYDFTSGGVLATWQSPPVAPNAALQVSVATLEAAATTPFAIPAFYAVGIQPTFTGSFQHVLYRPAEGTLTNVSNCDSGVTTNGAKLASVHSSQVAPGFPSILMIYNTAPNATAVTFGVYDARDGSRLGGFSTVQIAAGGQSAIRVTDVESVMRLIPPAGLYHYTMKVESPFTGVLQHLVDNQRVSVITDMTTVCALSGS